ncbi:MAG: hypothetical protein IJ644_05240 [Oscillospiraceae bacterium]|nr:hypothetical protein [Oscillospiraceae bacterium]
MKLYTDNEIRAVRYYIGDVRNLPEDGFWNDPKAYCLLNALFFPEISAESSRIAEGKQLNPELLADVPRLAGLLKDLFSVFRKSASGRNYQTFRVERFRDYEQMRLAGKTISFTSTSCAGFLKAYQDRCGIALLKFQIPMHTPCIVMQDFFPEYAKPEEAEILLPPRMKLHFEDLSLSEQEQTILDADGNPPVCACSVTVQNDFLPDVLPCSDVPEGGNIAGIRVIKALQNHQSPNNQDVALYSLWKQHFLHEILKNHR